MLAPQGRGSAGTGRGAVMDSHTIWAAAVSIVRAWTTRAASSARRCCMPHDLPPMETSRTRRRVLQSTVGGAVGLVAWHQGWPRLQRAAAQKHTPSGQMTWAIHVTLAPAWLDPSETPALVTPYMLLYAVHDALLKPMPDHSMA